MVVISERVKIQGHWNRLGSRDDKRMRKPWVECSLREWYSGSLIPSVAKDFQL